MGDDLTCSVIGSFRKHYDLVLECIEQFERHGVIVRSPLRSEILQPDVRFVRLEADDPRASDEEVQLVALHRILSSGFVFVLVVDGYVGPTTAYEIGRAVERRLPIFFSSLPTDLPVPIPESAVIDAATLASEPQRVRDAVRVSEDERVHDLHEDLLDGRLWDEPRIHGARL